jgi:hypothetical protein
MLRLILMAIVLTARLMAAEPLRFEPRHIEQRIAGCGNEKDGCAHADFTYVELVSGPRAIRERINAAIRKRVGEGSTPGERARGFLALFGRPRTAQANFLSGSVEVLRAAPPVVSLEYSDCYFTGGPHDYFDTYYLNFDARTGDAVSLASVLKNGSLSRLTAIAEEHFRKDHKLSPTAGINDAGFWFPDNRFKLNDNFGLSEKSLLFLFNIYEIRPYAGGPTKIEIPLPEIRELLRPEFLR